MNCQAPIENTIKFNSWIECANAGYSNAIEVNNKLGSNFVNRNKGDWRITPFYQILFLTCKHLLNLNK